ncbi:hypothetical protein APHAL10511_003840 [Amanita phalloides]|nr:hypothetical protein APHAL10511_003840 [Amanita phalloides]
MPAERSKVSAKRANEAKASQLVWAVDFPASLPAYPAATGPIDCSVSFVDNMTPTSFDNTVSHYEVVCADEPPPLVDAPIATEFQFFSPTDEHTFGSKRSAHSKKKPENHIPRPPNAFILFRSSFIKSQHVSAEVETNHSTLSKIIGMTWQSLPEDERQAWHAKARIALAEHRRKFPKYTFRPAQNKAKCKGGGDGKAEGTKRKVREVEPKDLKRCAKIAELLVEGKKGAELDAAIQEFDKHHVPEIITRFEAPITAHAFRRPSSAPIPETENSKKTQTFCPNSPVLQAKDGKRKGPRAPSMQPTRCSTPKCDEPITATLKQESSIDFSAFSFAQMNQPGLAFQCEPLLPVPPVQSPTLLQIKDSYTAPAPLNIPNMPSFLMDDWSLSSPVSQYSHSDAFGCSSPVDPFDTQCAFDNLDLQHDDKHFAFNDPTDLASLSLGQPEYNLNAGVDFNINMGMANLVSAFESTDYMNLIPPSSCSQQQQQQQQQYPHQHQPMFIPEHHVQMSPPQQQHQNFMPTNFNIDMTLMAPQTEFVL